MLLSMTGHGEAHSQKGEISVTVEVRTINNRYLKISVRSGEGYGAIEPRVEASVRESIRRGTVNVAIKIDRARTSDDYRLNQEVLLGYWRQLEAIANKEGLSSLRMDNLLGLPGVVDENSNKAKKLDEDWAVVSNTLEEALKNLSSMRRDEGAAMARDLLANCEEILGNINVIEERAPLVVKSYEERLTEKMNRLLAEHDVKVEPADVVREVGVFADRCDISEELVRMRSHLKQFEAFMNEKESTGRKLEFLTQEMFRETNTIGSKANDSEISKRVIDIKTAIERVREMIQNVE